MDSATVTGMISGIPTDWIIIGSAAVLLVVLALYAGISNLTAFSIGIFITLALAPLVQQTVFISRFAANVSDGGTSMILFASLFVPLFFMARWLTRDTFEDVGPLQAILAGCATVAVALAAWQHIPAFSSLWDFGGAIDSIFSQDYRLLWFLGALLALTFSRG